MSPVSVVVFSILRRPFERASAGVFPEAEALRASLPEKFEVLLSRPLMLGSRSVRGIVPPRGRVRELEGAMQQMSDRRATKKATDEEPSKTAEVANMLLPS